MQSLYLPKTCIKQCFLYLDTTTRLIASTTSIGIKLRLRLSRWVAEDEKAVRSAMWTTINRWAAVVWTKLIFKNLHKPLVGVSFSNTTWDRGSPTCVSRCWCRKRRRRVDRVGRRLSPNRSTWFRSFAVRRGCRTKCAPTSAQCRTSRSSREWRPSRVRSRARNCWRTSRSTLFGHPVFTS